MIIVLFCPGNIRNRSWADRSSDSALIIRLFQSGSTIASDHALIPSDTESVRSRHISFCSFHRLTIAEFHAIDFPIGGAAALQTRGHMEAGYSVEVTNGKF
jgi:hypothetical protein